MEKIFFVEIVFNNESKFHNETRYLKGYVKAKDKTEAEQLALDHFRPYYTGGENGQFYVQCNWEVKVPIREIVEKHWKKASKSEASIPTGPTFESRERHYFFPDTTKKDVMESWDLCHISWANPVIHYDQGRGGYSIMIHSHMCMPAELVFFKGTTKRAYYKARKFVKDNTLKDTYFRAF